MLAPAVTVATGDTQAGTYTVTATNSQGSVTSAGAVVTVKTRLVPGGVEVSVIDRVNHPVELHRGSRWQIADRGHVLAIGNASVDVIADADDALLEREGMHKGAMQLVGEDEAEELRKDARALLDEQVADVVTGPLLEHLDEELSVLLGADGPVRHEIALLPVQRPLTGSPSPAGLGQGKHLGGDPLHDGDELDELRSDLVAQERVDLAAVVAVGGVDGRERVPVDAVRHRTAAGVTPAS